MRTVAVGDIHGEAAALGELLDWVDTRSDIKRIVFLGDYVGRGSDSKVVLDMLSARHLADKRFVFLLGNHDYNLLSCLREGDPRRLLSEAGLPIIGSYLRGHETNASDWESLFISSFPHIHLNFLASLNLFFEDESFFYSHCGINLDLPERRELEDLVLGGNMRLFDLQPAILKKRLVFGHYVQDSGVPFTSKSVICLDTGSGTRRAAPLTAMYMDSLEYRQFGAGK